MEKYTVAVSNVVVPSALYAGRISPATAGQIIALAKGVDNPTAVGLWLCIGVITIDTAGALYKASDRPILGLPIILVADP